MGAYPFQWIVYHRDSSKAMVATGATGSEDTARTLVEFILRESAEASHGLVIAPSGFHFTCRRERDKKTMAWAPMF